MAVRAIKAMKDKMAIRIISDGGSNLKCLTILFPYNP